MFPTVLVVFVLYLWFLDDTLKKRSAHSLTITPSLVWLMIIPIFGVIAHRDGVCALLSYRPGSGGSSRAYSWLPLWFLFSRNNPFGHNGHRALDSYFSRVSGARTGLERYDRRAWREGRHPLTPQRGCFCPSCGMCFPGGHFCTRCDAGEQQLRS